MPLPDKELQRSEHGKLTGRVAVVTGAAGGIGRATALALAQTGARVVVSDMQLEAGEAAAALIRTAGGQAVFVSCDVSEPAQVARLIEQTVEEYGALHILVNNAGISGGSSLAHEMDIELWDRVMAVNVRGPFLCVKAAMPHLLASGHQAAIINIASTYGLIGALRAPAYCASKGALVNLTRQLAVDYGPQGIRVNAVCPGYIDTDMGGSVARLPAEQAAAARARREANAALQPLGRQAQADEVARVVAFLASDDSSFMTGSIVTVDGGCTATFNHGPR